MLQTILIIIAYVSCMAAGGFTNYFNPLKKIITLVVIGIGGFFFCLATPYPLNWVGWSSYMFGFVVVLLMGKQAAKEQFKKQCQEALGEDLECISIDKNGHPKITYLKVIEGGK